MQDSNFDSVFKFLLYQKQLKPGRKSYVCTKLQMLHLNSLLFSFQLRLSQDLGEDTAQVGHGGWWN